jgi:hypothetical protein
VLIWLQLVALMSGVPQISAEAWNVADRMTKRLPPSAFSNLPTQLRTDLERRGCTIPQPYGASEPDNVIRGRFTSSGQTDWAVLCSRAQVSSILLFRGGSPSAVVELASRPDRHSLQGVGGGRIGFSRKLGVATPKSIQDFYKAYGGHRPPPLDHDGIEDAFVDKASVIKYWYRDRWLDLQGSD